jgi:hypothetical protein
MQFATDRMNENSYGLAENLFRLKAKRQGM